MELPQDIRDPINKVILEELVVEVVDLNILVPVVAVLVVLGEV